MAQQHVSCHVFVFSRPYCERGRLLPCGHAGDLSWEMIVFGELDGKGPLKERETNFRDTDRNHRVRVIDRTDLPCYTSVGILTAVR